VQLTVTRSGPSTASNSVIYSYILSVHLPNSDSLAAATFYGTLYSPFSTTIYNCSNVFVYTAMGSSQAISITNLSVTGKALNYFGEIEMLVTFSKSRTIFLRTSTLEISLSAINTRSISTCTLLEAQNLFSYESKLTNRIILSTKSDIANFASTYTIRCSNVILSSNNPSLQIFWIEAGSILQQSPVVTTTLSLPSSNSALALVSNKNYNSLGYSSEVQFSISLNVQTITTI